METPRAIVSAILEKQENGVRHVYLQTRQKPATSATYSGLIEIPAGGIDGYENVFMAVEREVFEETGLRVTRILERSDRVTENVAGSKSMVFQPFVCQQMLSSDNGLPWVGFVFRCEVEGDIAVNKEEAAHPRWVTVPELKALLETSPRSFFPLQYPVLVHYVETVK